MVVASVLLDASSDDWPPDQPLFLSPAGPEGAPGLARSWHETKAGDAEAKSKAYWAAMRKFEKDLTIPVGDAGAIEPESLLAYGYPANDDGRRQALAEIKQQAAQSPSDPTTPGGAALPRNELFEVWPPPSVQRLLDLRKREQLPIRTPPQPLPHARPASFSIRGRGRGRGNRGRGGRGRAGRHTGSPVPGADAAAAPIEPRGSVLMPDAQGPMEAALEALRSPGPVFKGGERVLVADEAPPYVWPALVRATKRNKDIFPSEVRGELFLEPQSTPPLELDIEYLFPADESLYSAEAVGSASRASSVTGQPTALGCATAWQRNAQASERYATLPITSIGPTIKLTGSHCLDRESKLTYAVAQRTRMSLLEEELNADESDAFGPTSSESDKAE